MTARKHPVMKKLLDFRFSELNEKNWNAFEELFGKNGACAGCWCMYYRQQRPDYRKNKGEGNKNKMRQLVKKGEVPGILAFDGNRAVGWCSVAPREKFIALERSRILKRVDERPVWSIVCFFIAKDYRRSGLTYLLLEHIKEYGEKNGAKIIEGYPVDPKGKDYAASFAWTGFLSAFIKAGFREVIRRSDTRPIMRYEINNS